MKINRLLFFSTFFCLTMVVVNAQYTILHNFNDTAGAWPIGTITLSGKTLFGTTSFGGANSHGCIFSMDTNGNNFKDIFDFGAPGIGSDPTCGLTLIGNKLYGMTPHGGVYDSGTLYSIDTNGSGYKDLLDFNGINGKDPYGSLTDVGAKLFGMTYEGGANFLGTIFTIDTAGHNYKHLYDFTGYGGGGYPEGNVTIIKDKLFGMSKLGANSDAFGNIFSLDSNGTNYIDLYDFDGYNGAYPNELLTHFGTQFFGMTFEGGANYLGNIFSIDTAGYYFKNILDFDGTIVPYGEYPDGNMTFSGNVLYGMTTGYTSDSGSIFFIDTNGNNYTVLYNFTAASGYFPQSDLLIVGNTLYGSTYKGGRGANASNQGGGVIFKFEKNANTGINKLKNTASVNVWPNPSGGKFTVQVKCEELRINSIIEVYNILGQQVYSTQYTIPSTQYSLDLSNQPNGVYLYRFISESGNLLGQGKLLIQK